MPTASLWVSNYSLALGGKGRFLNVAHGQEQVLITSHLHVSTLKLYIMLPAWSTTDPCHLPLHFETRTSVSVAHSAHKVFSHSLHIVDFKPEDWL